MYIYTLDSLYRRIDVVDRFISLIWADRHRAFGDFELVVNSTFRNRQLFTEGTKLFIAESKAVMTVETVEDRDQNGERTLKISGRSLEKILLERLAMGALDDLTDTPKWVLTGTPDEIAAQIFHDICVEGILDEGDILDVVESGAIFPPDTIDFPVDSITYEIDMASVYDAIKRLCDAYYMGFRLVLDDDTHLLYWNIYTGSDRTSAQTDLPAVIFSPTLGNLSNTTELKSIALLKNVAYVFSAVGYEVVYADGVDPDVAGFERRVLIVKADDITDPDGPTASAQMIQRGKEQLAAARRVFAFDGELNQRSGYIYGRDYNLGDLVEQRSVDGVTNIMQVTEQIFVQDVEGFRAYPTLTFYNLILPGEWASIGPDVNWDDFDDEDWDDMP